MNYKPKSRRIGKEIRTYRTMSPLSETARFVLDNKKRMTPEREAMIREMVRHDRVAA